MLLVPVGGRLSYPMQLLLDKGLEMGPETLNGPAVLSSLRLDEVRVEHLQ